MKLHANARSCPNSRRLLVRRVEEGWSLAAAAEAAGVSGRTGRKWVARWRIEGDAGLVDRSSAPRRCPSRLSQSQVSQAGFDGGLVSRILSSGEETLRGHGTTEEVSP